MWNALRRISLTQWIIVAMVTGIDGTIFCGESERGGKLFLYLPGPAPFEGNLNPANPPLERMKPMPVIHGPAKALNTTP